jgi:hypothetical protein
VRLTPNGAQNNHLYSEPGEIPLGVAGRHSKSICAKSNYGRARFRATERDLLLHFASSSDALTPSKFGHPPTKSSVGPMQQIADRLQKLGHGQYAVRFAEQVMLISAFFPS